MLTRLSVALALSFTACGAPAVARPPPAALDPSNRDSMSQRLELMVGDLQRSVSFYTGTMGFELVRSETDHAVVRAGKVEFGLHLASSLPSGHYFNPELATQRKGLGAELVLEVNDVTNYAAAVMEARGTILTPLTRQAWGATDFRIADPDGYYLRVTSRN